jgi:hypothetical protein
VIARPAWAALIGLAAGIVGLVACGGSAAPSPDASRFGHLPVAATFRTNHAPSMAGAPIAVVRLGQSSYLACDYSNVYRVATTSSGYAVTILAPPPVPVWAPAGLDYRNGSLYVANFNGEDVLQLRLVGDRLDLVRRITIPGMLQPKRVHVNPDGSMLVADHNSDAVLRLRPDGTLDWRVRIEQVNGLAESGGYAYASSLVNRTITKIDMAGHAVDHTGSIGVEVGGYLLPVDVADLGSRIAVTDAVNGRITILDHDLHVVGHVGGNGPGLNALNYPFAVLSIPNGYLIADTYKRRLLRLDRGWTIQEQIVLGPWVPIGRERPLVSGSSAHPFTYDSLPGVDIAAELGLRQPLHFTGAYGGLDHVGPGRAVLHLDLTDPDFGDTNAAWATKVGRYIVAGSAESYNLEVIDPATAMFTYVVVGEDNWWFEGALLTPVGLRLALSTVIQPAVARLVRAQRLTDQGASRQEVVQAALAGQSSHDLARDLTSPEGQQFLHSRMGMADADQFFASAMHRPQQRVIELLLVKFLSGY